MINANEKAAILDASAFADSLQIINKIIDNDGDMLLSLERDSMIARCYTGIADDEEKTYKFVLQLMNELILNRGMRFYWTCKNDDYLFMSCMSIRS